MSWSGALNTVRTYRTRHRLPPRGRITVAEKPSPLCAVLDLGSNSFHLIIGRIEDGRIVVVDRRKDMVRLAEGLQDDGFLDEAVIHRALESLGVFAQQLRQLETSRVRVVGTNTLRAAKNADGFLNQAEVVIGAPIDIISGREEGRLIFLGVSKALAQNNVRRLVIDIGGGSTELIIGRKRAKKIESLFIGCVSYSERFFPSGKVSAKAYQRALTTARAEFEPLTKRYGKEGNWEEAIGTSGTVRSIESVIEELQPHGHVITRGGVERIVDEMIRGRRAEVFPILNENRAAVFAGGVAILHAAFLELSIDELHVSDYALKEGVLYELVETGAYEDTRRKTIEFLTRQFRVDRRQAAAVEQFALAMLPDLADSMSIDVESAQRILSAAARLHELGLTISHSGYHKHGAYILENADMPGFSRREQKLLSFLVLNHRRRLRIPIASYRFVPEWGLVLLLRLSCLFNRSRARKGAPVPGIKMRGASWNVKVDGEWLANQPLLVEDLSQEAAYWRELGHKLVVNGERL